MSVTFKYAARSDVGLVRSNNQDTGYAGPQLLVVADGMGGAAGGDIASSVTVAHLAPLDGDSHGADDLLDSLRDSVIAAHSDLVEFSKASPELAGLGTTCIALLRSGKSAAMIHIGDSRAYVMRDSKLAQITHDHTFVQHLVDTGQITPDQAEVHPQRSVILRALGSETDPELDESVRELRIGERWLLCSDGLSSLVSHETIEDTLAEFTDLDECADELVNLALRAGGGDNITVIVADVVAPQAAPNSVPQVVGAAAVTRNQPTRGGDSAAAKAAAIMRPLMPPEPEEAPEPKPRRGIKGLIWSVVIAAVVVGGLAVGYRWTQTQYYVAPHDSYVAIYQGIPQKIGSLELSEVVHVSTVPLDELPTFAVSRLEENIVVGSREEADVVLSELAVEVALNNLQNQTRPTPTPTPTPHPESTDTETPDDAETPGGSETPGDTETTASDGDEGGVT